jgi:hypothetical protein
MGSDRKSGLDNGEMLVLNLLAVGMGKLLAGRKEQAFVPGCPAKRLLWGASVRASENGHSRDGSSRDAALARNASASPAAWLYLARESRYDEAEVRRRLGLGAGQAELPGDPQFGLPVQEWLDLVRVWDAGLLLWEGCSRSEIELALSISDGPSFWTWSDDFVDVIGRHHAGRVIRIQRRTCEGCRQEQAPVGGLPWPEGLELSGPWMPALAGLSAICHRPKGPGAEECPLAKRGLFAGECLQLRISLGVARAREAFAGLLLSDVSLRKRLESLWPRADEHLIAEAIEDAILDYIDNPRRFDPNRGKTLASFLLLIALRRMANSERTEDRQGQRLENLVLAEEALGPFPSLSASAPSPAELFMAAEDDAERERIWARRRLLLDEFAQHQSTDDRQILEMMLRGERHYAPYAKVLGITARLEFEQREIVNREKHSLHEALRRWALKLRERGLD